MLGGAFSLSAAQSAFANKMTHTLRTSAPDVNPFLLVGTGATEIRKVFTSEQIPGILVAYMNGIKATFAIAIGLVGFACLVSLNNTWKRLHSAGGEKTAVAVMA